MADIHAYILKTINPVSACISVVLFFIKNLLILPLFSSNCVVMGSGIPLLVKNSLMSCIRCLKLSYCLLPIFLRRCFAGIFVFSLNSLKRSPCFLFDKHSIISFSGKTSPLSPLACYHFLIETFIKNSFISGKILIPSNTIVVAMTKHHFNVNVGLPSSYGHKHLFILLNFFKYAFSWHFVLHKTK